jgi:hypothetical protein
MLHDLAHATLSKHSVILLVPALHTRTSMGPSFRFIYVNVVSSVAFSGIFQSCLVHQPFEMLVFGYVSYVANNIDRGELCLDLLSG